MLPGRKIPEDTFSRDVTQMVVVSGCSDGQTEYQQKR